jgi:hypothetical protein
MKLYADLPGRRSAQVVGDLLALGWVLGCVSVGRLVFDAVHQLRGPADQLHDAGGVLRDGMGSALAQVRDVPLVGSALRTPFQALADTGTGVAQAGSDLGTAVDRLALVLGLVVAVVPLLVIIVIWVRVRGRFIVEASSAARFIDADADLDLFALRALARAPMSALARISDDPAGGWRRRDPAVVRALAVLELRDSGLREPPVTG